LLIFKGVRDLKVRHNIILAWLENLLMAISCRYFTCLFIIKCTFASLNPDN
jgi:hypothetical protein